MGWNWARDLALFTITAILGCVALALLPALAPGGIRATGEAYRLDASLTPSTTSKAFDGVPAVGALFTMNGGKLGTHICTASVVASTRGDLALTAAHCVTGLTKQVVFVPGYANGKEPYGVWPVTAVYTNQAWQSSRSPADDFAFLRIADSHGVPVEHVTGAEQLGTGLSAPAVVRVIGYPDGKNQPIECVNRATLFSKTQLRFDCDSYTDGTSGGPFLANVSAQTGEGTVEGVIGGYQQGGDTADVSYASAFGPASTALFRIAEARG
jgi:V8-like Glu-specific endopeptidase